MRVCTFVRMHARSKVSLLPKRLAWESGSSSNGHIAKGTSTDASTDASNGQQRANFMLMHDHDECRTGPPCTHACLTQEGTPARSRASTLASHTPGSARPCIPSTRPCIPSTRLSFQAPARTHPTTYTPEAPLQLTSAAARSSAIPPLTIFSPPTTDSFSAAGAGADVCRAGGEEGDGEEPVW